VAQYPLEVVAEMFALGVEMRRERARREFPQLDEREIDAIVETWLLERPGAEIGDSAGVPGTWPRR